MAGPSPAGPTLLVLGAAAGGGSPQWNCACPICQRVRSGDEAAPRRTQTSISVTADGHRWALINAAPELAEQLLKATPLHPKRSGRHSPICAVVLTGAEVDQVTGLLTLREGHPFSLYGSQSTLGTLAQSLIFDVLPPDRVERRGLQLNEPFEICDRGGEPLGITAEAFAVPGKIPLYKETPGEVPAIGETTDENIALKLRLGEQDVFFIPGCAEVTDELLERLEGAAALFFDGTLWHDEELIEAGLSQKTGRRMGHVSVTGPGGAIEAFAEADIGQKIFIHINNSNPLLLADSPERQQAEAAGWAVAYDGMELSL